MAALVLAAFAVVVVALKTVVSVSVSLVFALVLGLAFNMSSSGHIYCLRWNELIPERLELLAEQV